MVWRAVIPCGVLMVVAVIVLLIAGSRPISVRAYSIEAENQVPVATLHPSQRACEGPITSPSPARSVAIWQATATRAARGTITVQRTATGATLTSGGFESHDAVGEILVPLVSALPAHEAARVCVTDDVGTLVLAGSGAQQPGVAIKGTDNEFSLLLFGPDRSLLSSLSTAFNRASLWRPSWVGSWTFWVLCFALLGTFGLGAVITVTATSADEHRAEPDAEEGGGSDPPPVDDGSDERSPTTASLPH